MHLTAPSLIVLVGPSGSGKSAWAAARFQPSEVVSSDDLRAVVGAGREDLAATAAAFRLLDEIVTERLRRKMTTVVDTTGLDDESRARWSHMARAAGVDGLAVAFDTTLETCLRRNAKRERPVPQEVIRRQHRRFKSLMVDIANEDFDRVEVVAENQVEATEPLPTSRREPVASRPRHSFGLLVSRFDWKGLDSIATLTSIAQRAELAGFRDLWLMDHFRQIRSVGREWEDIFEPYTTLAFVAAHTTKIRLGVLVSSITHRHPVVVGQMLATLDNLSDGRVNCGLGLGWDAEEHQALGIAFPGLEERYEILEDSLRILPLVWGPGSPAFAGTHINADSLVCYPRPVQEHIPILVGGGGEKTLRLVAQHADACNVFGDPQTVAHKVEVLADHCASVDREIAEVEVSHLLTAMTGSSRAELMSRADSLRSRNTPAETYLARAGALPTAEMIELMANYSEAGATHTVVALPDVHLEGSVEGFAPVIDSFR